MSVMIEVTIERLFERKKTLDNLNKNLENL